MQASSSAAAGSAAVASTSQDGWSGFAWRMGQGICSGLRTAWDCFDRTAGWALGLDVPKYQWAVLEHERQKEEAEGLVMNSEAQREHQHRLDAMEGAIAQTPQSAPAQATMQGGREKVELRSPEFRDVPLTSP